MIAPTPPALLVAYALLFFFGIGYNWFVGWLERKGYHEGYVAFLVMGGVIVTLGAVAVFDPDGALIALGAFLASGTPMIVGSVTRYIRERERVARAKAESANAKERSPLAK